MAHVEAKASRDCAPEEKTALARLVLKAGEVAAAGLPQRVEEAVALAFLRSERGLVGVGGLKRPEKNYRERVSRSSKIALLEDDFPFELGWIYAEKEARGGASRSLSEALLPFAAGRGVFATSRVNNPWMHATLLALGFARVGAEWPSGHNPANLALFTREAGAT
jgi:hypothetical protein